MNLREKTVEYLAEAHGVSKSVAAKIFDTIFSSIPELIKEHKRVDVRGFGAFVAKDIKPRKRRNPRTGEPVDCPAYRKISFVPAKSLRRI